MSLRLPLRRAVLCVAVVAGFCFAVPAMASAAQTIAVTPCNLITCTPQNSTFTAGGSSSATAAITFDTGHSGPKLITTQLGAGVLANLSSSTAGACISGVNAADSAPCMIGGGFVDGVVAVTAYLTPPNPLSSTPPGNVVAGLDLSIPSVPAVLHGDVSVEQLSGGQVVGVLTSDLSPDSSLAATVTSMTLNINGKLPDGSLLTRMPTACALATATHLNVAYFDGSSDGPTNASPDVDVSGTCKSGSLGSFTPSLTGSATTTGARQGAAVSTVVSFPATQAADAFAALSVPGSVLSPNPVAISLANTTTPVGTVAAQSPLLPVPITGQAFLIECTTLTPGQSGSCPPGVATPGLGLSLKFTSPLTLTLSGSVSLAGSVTFASVPDVPISALAVNLTGGPEALFTAPCALSSGTLSAALVAQNTLTANPSATFNVTGCPPITTTAGKPKASGGSLTGLASGHPKLHFNVSHGSNAPNIKTVSVGVPSGLSFHSSKTCKGSGKKRKCTTGVKGLSVSGGSVKSAKVSGGRLVITLKAAAGSVSVTVKGPGLAETGALKTKVKKHKVKSLTVNIKVTDAKGTATSISLKLSV